MKNNSIGQNLSKSNHKKLKPTDAEKEASRLELAKRFGQFIGGTLGVELAAMYSRPIVRRVQKTYLFTDGIGFKIGRAMNPHKRLLALKNANPNLKMICIINKDVELMLHKKYKDRAISKEWYNLNREDVEYIKSLCHE